jgi:membrane-bound ClpP family serine protease
VLFSKTKKRSAADISPTNAIIPPLVGKSGIARSDLRPTGIAEIAGQRYDVVSQGDFIDAGSSIKVIATENYRIIVAKQWLRRNTSMITTI